MFYITSKCNQFALKTNQPKYIFKMSWPKTYQYIFSLLKLLELLVNLSRTTATDVYQPHYWVTNAVPSEPREPAQKKNRDGFRKTFLIPITFSYRQVRYVRDTMNALVTTTGRDRKSQLTLRWQFIGGRRDNKSLSAMPQRFSERQIKQTVKQQMNTVHVHIDIR